MESDSATQEEVSKMTPLVDKILFMIDRHQSEPANYSLFSSQVASNTLFYCTFNVNSAQSLMDCGALAKMINITRELLVDKDGNTPLRYVHCRNFKLRCTIKLTSFVFGWVKTFS